MGLVDVVESVVESVVAIDGKTAQGRFDGPNTALHMISAYATKAMQSGILSRALASLLALFGLSANAQPEADAPAIQPTQQYQQYLARIGEQATQTLTLANNGRFSMRLAARADLPAGEIEWLGDWQPKGAQLCLTPDPPAFFLYARENDAEGKVLTFDLMDSEVREDEKARLAFSFSASKHFGVPQGFTLLGSPWAFIGIPRPPKYLFIARIARTGGAVEIQRYQISPKQEYRLRSANGIPSDIDEIRGDDLLMEQSFLFLKIFTEYRDLPEPLLLPGKAEVSEPCCCKTEKPSHQRVTLPAPVLLPGTEADRKLRVVLREDAENLAPPYCGTLDETRMQIQIAPGQPAAGTREHEDFLTTMRRIHERMRRTPQTLERDSSYRLVEGTALGKHSPRLLPVVDGR
ncbi:MAG: hypothetical protein LBO00_03100 [Zoogloeaceae bacterium]|jgi:hypothetical protein|nr:hypothetical protein [Zoogloeaceae bacterium]